MPAIRSRLDVSSPAFRANAQHHRALAEDLRRRVAEVAEGGGAEAQKKHIARGKLLPRDRVRGLLDPGAPFLELSQLAAFGMYGGDAPSAGLVTGIGRVEGREVVIVANDATVKGGTYYPLTVKKHLRAQEIAAQNRLPCIYLVDSGAPSCRCRTRYSRTGSTSGGSSTTRRRCRRAAYRRSRRCWGRARPAGRTCPR